jgi:carbon starvation protein
MTIPALIIQLAAFWRASNYLLVVMDVVILGASIMVALEAMAALGRTRRELAAATTPA